MFAHFVVWGAHLESNVRINRMERDAVELAVTGRNQKQVAKETGQPESKLPGK